MTGGDPQSPCDRGGGWEVTGHVGDTTLTFVTLVVQKPRYRSAGRTTPFAQASIDPAHITTTGYVRMPGPDRASRLVPGPATIEALTRPAISLPADPSEPESNPYVGGHFIPSRWPAGAVNDCRTGADERSERKARRVVGIAVTVAGANWSGSVDRTAGLCDSRLVPGRASQHGGSAHQRGQA